jgi:hypothetical protein
MASMKDSPEMQLERARQINILFTKSKEDLLPWQHWLEHQPHEYFWWYPWGKDVFIDKVKKRRK